MSEEEEQFCLPRYEDIPESEHGTVLREVLGICAKLLEINKRQETQLQLQQERIHYLEEQVACLKDEIAILKGEKGRPDIKPSNLNKAKHDNNQQDRKKDKRSGKGKKSKKLQIHKTEILRPSKIPTGSVFKGYEDYIVQDMKIGLHNVKYRRARYQAPDGKTVCGELPKEIQGTHFGHTLRSYILMQYFQQHVPQRLILKQLWEFGVQISAGQLSLIITTNGHRSFHQEKEAVLRAGLSVSSYINVDDTGARHKGKNGYCTHIGNELFTWFSSTKSKSRINFLGLLRTGHADYVIDEVAREYMKSQRLPNQQINLFSTDQVIPDSSSWQQHLKKLGIVSEPHQRIATEAALLASIFSHGLSPKLIVLSDDAGQFNVAGLLNALCWIHAERTIKKIIPFSETNRLAQERVREQIWNFYQNLKQYKLSHSEQDKITLQKQFDQIFLQNTCFQSLNLALTRIWKNKAELLLVLDRPEIPLHNNLSENDIRDYVTKRKISATTRSDSGQQARDTFLSLKKTCNKLHISFWQYLLDRTSQSNMVPQLSTIIHLAAQAN